MEKNVEDLLRNYQTTSFHLPSPAFHFFHLIVYPISFGISRER